MFRKRQAYLEDCHSFYQLVQDLEEEGQWVDEKLNICTATIQGCKKFLIPPPLGGSLSSLFGKNIKLERGEGNIMAGRKNITWKNGKGEAISSFL